MTTAPIDETETAATVAGRAPVAAPAVGYVGALIALLILGLGVVALRDSAVTAGWLDGTEWTTNAIGWIDGLAFDWWTVPVGVAAVLIGVATLGAALRPRRRTAIAVTAVSSVWIAPADLARLASHYAETVPGVLTARSSATLSKLTVSVGITAEHASSDVTSAVATSVADGIAAIVDPPPKIRVRTRTGVK